MSLKLRFKDASDSFRHLPIRINLFDINWRPRSGSSGVNYNSRTNKDCYSTWEIYTFIFAKSVVGLNAPLCKYLGTNKHENAVYKITFWYDIIIFIDRDLFVVVVVIFLLHCFNLQNTTVLRRKSTT